MLKSTQKSILTVLLVAAVSVVSLEQCVAASRYAVSLAFPTKTGNTAEVFFPKGIAIDSKGDIFVTGSLHGAEEYGPDGQWLRSFGADKPMGGVADVNGGKLYTPLGIATDSSGSVYVVDGLTETIQKYGPDAAFIGAISVKSKIDGQPTLMIGIAVGPDGTVYTTDNTTQSVMTFSSAGAPGAAFGSKGSGKGQFANPRFLAVDQTRFSVVDSRNFRVQVFNTDGTYLRQFGTMGSSDGQFTNPDGIGIDANHNTFVGDGDHIDKFASDGSFLTTISIPSTSYRDPGFNGRYHYSTILSGIMGIAVDPAGDVYVADSANKRVVVFKPSP